MRLREVVKTRLERFTATVDGVISAISPSWGLRRVRQRTAARMLGAYRGAEKTRLRGDWTALHGSADADLLPDLPTLRQRSRDLNRNDAHASAITATVVENVVGTGLRPQSRPDVEELGATEAEGQLFAKKAEKAWRRWCRQADAQNRMHFHEMQGLIKRQILENGEVFLLPLMITDPGRRYRLALEVIEADRVSTPTGKHGPNMRDGIELGERGQPIAYWIKKRHPGDMQLGLSGVSHEWVRYPAMNRAGRPNVLHLYHVKRPGQTRGEPFFAPVLSAFKDLGDFMEAEIVAARVAACFTAFITKNDPAAAFEGTAVDAQGNRIDSLEPGMTQYLAPGESVTFGDPKRPTGTFEPFVLAVLRSIGSSLGLPLELVLKDFSRTNYSSARAAMLEARRFFRGYQSWLSERLCQPCWEWVMEEAWLKGELPAVDLFGDDREEWMRVHWIAPGWGWVDPVKEVESSKLAIEAGLSTHADECAAQGRDWEEVFAQQKRERQKRDELGLTPAPAAPPQPIAIQPEDEGEEPVGPEKKTDPIDEKEPVGVS